MPSRVNCEMAAGVQWRSASWRVVGPVQVSLVGGDRKGDREKEGMVKWVEGVEWKRGMAMGVTVEKEGGIGWWSKRPDMEGVRAREVRMRMREEVRTEW